jgi:hypothetical protein
MKGDVCLWHKADIAKKPTNLATLRHVAAIYCLGLGFGPG